MKWWRYEVLRIQNKSDIRELYEKLKTGKLYNLYYRLEDLCFSKSKKTLRYAHIDFETKRAYELLKTIKKNYKHCFDERMVGSGPVNGGESWGDFYDCFLKSDKNKRQIIVDLFNEHQKETPFGFYIEIKA